MIEHITMGNTDKVFNKINDNNIYKQAIETFGENNQILKSVEELSELIKELIKQGFSDFKNIDTIIEELADVEIMLEQLKLIFNCHNRVAEVHQMKLQRLQQRIDDHGQ